jgi:hypothetical protein
MEARVNESPAINRLPSEASVVDASLSPNSIRDNKEIMREEEDKASTKPSEEVSVAKITKSSGLNQSSIQISSFDSNSLLNAEETQKEGLDPDHTLEDGRMAVAVEKTSRYTGRYTFDNLGDLKAFLENNCAFKDKLKCCFVYHPRREIFLWFKKQNQHRYAFPGNYFSSITRNDLKHYRILARKKDARRLFEGYEFLCGNRKDLISHRGEKNDMNNLSQGKNCGQKGLDLNEAVLKTGELKQASIAPPVTDLLTSAFRGAQSDDNMKLEAVIDQMMCGKTLRDLQNLATSQRIPSLFLYLYQNRTMLRALYDELTGSNETPNLTTTTEGGNHTDNNQGTTQRKKASANFPTTTAIPAIPEGKRSRSNLFDESDMAEEPSGKRKRTKRDVTGNEEASYESDRQDDLADVEIVTNKMNRREKKGN